MSVRLYIGLVSLILSCASLSAAQNSECFNGAKWIWFPEVTPGPPPECTRYFRAELFLPHDLKDAKAHLIITCDNLWTLYLNGKGVGESEQDNNAWRIPKKFDVTTLIQPGRNVVAVEATNTLPGPAALLLKFVVECGGKQLTLVTDEKWKVTDQEVADWQIPDFNDSSWPTAKVIGTYGIGPWGRFEKIQSERVGLPSAELFDPQISGGVVFLRGNVPKSHHFAFNILDEEKQPRSIQLKAYPENDVPAPAVLGRQMFRLLPARPGVKPVLLFDAGQGTLGSPSVSYDGKTIYFSMAPPGAGFYHIYRISADGGVPTQLTSGPFHDYDPEELPNGRIVFSSTRLGSREEYHGNLASSLFVMNADGSGIHPLTYHIVADREPRMTSSGALVLIRSDNFMERAKVETQIFLIRPEGTGGIVLLGNDRGAIPYNRFSASDGAARPGWLRDNGFGSPAPLPDGRVAALSKDGLVLSDANAARGQKVPVSRPLFDISPLPDGRLLCTTQDRKFLAVVDVRSGHVKPFFMFRRPEIHSPVFLGPRPKPFTVASCIPHPEDQSTQKTGYLYCQNVFRTKQTHADLARIKAIRVLEGAPLAIRPDHFPYEHIGVEAVELGTVPLAADGSFYVRVPADRALALQAVDTEGRAVISELTWIYVRPGERRSCVGCHSPRTAVPKGGVPLEAAHNPPVDLLGVGYPHRYRGNNAETGGIFNLQYDRHRETASIDLYPEPTRADNGPGRTSVVANLCKQLSDSSTAVKVSSIQRLAIFRHRSATLPLCKMLTDQNALVRMNAALALAACGTKDALALLHKASRDTDPNVARAAKIAVEHLTGQFASEQVLVKRLADPDPQKVLLAAEALGHIGGHSAVVALIDFVQKNYEGKNKASDARTIMAAIRALGHLKAKEAVPLLASVLALDCTGPLARRNTHLAATAAEALGWIGTPEAEQVLLAACPKLLDFWHYTGVIGDHPVLVACHASPLHYRIMEALDAIGGSYPQAVPVLLRSVPGDLDRGLLVETDSYENLLARVAHSAGLTDTLIETCLHVLGDSAATPDTKYLADVTAAPLPKSWGDHAKRTFEELLNNGRNGLACIPYDSEMRAAQLLSVLALAKDARFASRVASTFERYRTMKVVEADCVGREYGRARTRAWVCFYLARALGKMRQRESADVLLAALDKDLPEAALGYMTPPSAIIHKRITPFYRASAAFALGRIGDRRAVPSLLKAVGNFDNALDVRHCAARALVMLCDSSDLFALEKLAANYPEVTTKRVLLEACAKCKR